MADENHTRGVLYGWKEIANYIGCTTPTARRYAKRKQLPVKKIGSRVMISRIMVEKWVEKLGNK